MISFTPMIPYDDRTDINVLVLYDLNPDWSTFEVNRVQTKIAHIQTDLQELGHLVTTLPVYDTHLKELLEGYDPNDMVILNFCEEFPGKAHSTSEVAAVLDDMGFTHTGPIAEVLDFTQGKIPVKKILDHHHISTPKWHVFTSLETEDWKIFPALVKPSLEHCSIGLSPDAVVFNQYQLKQRIDYVLKTFEQPALVEEFIDGREFRISLLEINNLLHMLPPSEMDYSYFSNVRERLLGFDSKNDPSSIYFREIKLIISVHLTEHEYQMLEQLVKQCYSLLNCRDFTGIDVRQRDGVFYVLDINPDPELTPDCSFTKAAALWGYTYGTLLSHIINLASHRHPVYSKTIKTTVQGYFSTPSCK